MAALDDHERDDQRRRDRETRQRAPGGPAPAVGLDECEDESDRAQRDGDRALNVVPALRGRLGPALRHDAGSQRQHHGADRHVDEEDPAPGECLHDHTPQQQSDRAPRTRDRAPDRERAVALRPFGEGREDDRQRRRRDQRAAEPLQTAGD